MAHSDTAHQSASTNTKIKTDSVQKTGKHELHANAQTVDWQPQRQPQPHVSLRSISTVHFYNIIS